MKTGRSRKESHASDCNNISIIESDEEDWVQTETTKIITGYIQ